MIKKVLIILIFGLFLFSDVGKTQTNIAEDTVDEAVVWGTDTILITGDVLIENGAVLTIEPNVQIISQGYYKIDVQGSIKAVGTTERPILFTVEDTTGFIDTTTENGGWNGIEFHGTPMSNDSSLFKHCIFEYGKAPGNNKNIPRGGAIYIEDFQKIAISNCVFNNNIATVGGGAIYGVGNSSIKICNNIFRNNICGKYGGAVCFFDGAGPIIKNNIFSKNIARFIHFDGNLVTKGGEGGGLYFQTQTDTPRIYNNIFSNNTGISSSAIYESTLHARIVSNIAVNNTGLGNTVFCGSQISKARYFNNTIVNNKGYGMTYASSYIQIKNNIIRNNQGTLPGENGQLHSFLLLEGEPTIKYNNIEDDPGGNNNIDQPSNFVEPTVGIGLMFNGLQADWRLQESSPEIDAGTVMGIEMDLPSTDVYGNPRITGENIDMGAAEYDFSSDIDVPEANEYVTVYPNPFTGQLWVEIEKQFPQEVRVQIVNANGQIIANREYHIDIMEFQSRSWPSGPYYLNILSEQGKLLHSAKVIKQ